MRKKIIELEKISKELEPDLSVRSAWNKNVINYADKFLDSVNEINTFNKYAEAEINKIDFGINENPSDIESVLKQVEKDIDFPGLNPASGGHLGYIPGGGTFATSLGDYLAAVFNKYAGIYYAGPGAVKLENTLIRWMCELVGFPQSSLGNLTSGGSIATLIAVTTARDTKNITSKKTEKSVIYLTEQVHHSANKAIKIAGLREAIIRYIPVVDSFKMDYVKLKLSVKEDITSGLIPFLIIASAGTTDTGAVDPLDEIADIASKHNIWLHTDAAYGGFFLLLDSLKSKFKGIEKSDSVTIDPHKGLFLSYGLGAVLMKDVNALNETHSYQANYMQDLIETPNEPSPADLSPELTKHFRGLRMWLPLKLYGLKPFKAALEEKILLTHYFYEEVQKIGFEVGPFPDLSVMIYRYVPKTGNADSFNLQIIEEVKKDGRVFLSSTRIKGEVWLRLAVLSFRTRLSTIDLALKILDKTIRKLF
ncbi:MAG: aminotransferase class I/II-fold pyridoxal phosphate-dependent enzyme [Bacteroidales bacterium]|nr:aminotransferase class I/II-fold pyridoxal phosphate-dependent enzyme [Bacteroidales bacterium]